MISGEFIGSTIELPAGVAEVIADHITSVDRRVAGGLQASGYTAEQALFAAQLWTMDSQCLTSVDLHEALALRGIRSEVLINEGAHEARLAVDGIADLVSRRDHAMVRLPDDDPVYIDMTWSQFLQAAGLGIEVALDNPGLDLVPAERHAAVSRAVQDKARRGSLAGRSDMFTARPSLAAFFMGQKVSLAVDYLPVTDLEAIAERIWNPSHFRVLDAAELEELHKKLNPTT